MKTWLMTMRIWALTATAMPVGLGAVLAYQAGHFSWVLFAMILTCGCFLQLATNLLNTYGDGVSGVDKDKPPCPLPLPVIRQAGIALLFASIALAGAIMALSTWKLLVFALLGVVGAAGYTTRFFKYAGFGVPGVFLLMGPLEVLATFFALTQTLSLKALLLSLPVGCLVAAILHGNDLRDMNTDQDAKIKTFSLLTGERFAFGLYVFLTLAPYVFLGGFMTVYKPFYAFLPPLLALPLGLALSRDALRRTKVETLEERSAGYHFLFCALMIVSLLVFGK